MTRTSVNIATIFAATCAIFGVAAIAKGGGPFMQRELLQSLCARADCVLFVAPVAARSGETGRGRDSAECQILAVARDCTGRYRAFDRLAVQIGAGERQVTRGLVFGSLDPGGRMVWTDAETEATATSFAYLMNAPDGEDERLLYALQFLDSDDALTANDAWTEVSRAPPDMLQSIARRFDPARLREKVADPKTPLQWGGFYAQLLGYCGAPKDAELMEQTIVAHTDDFRPGLDGLMSGYLLLAGEPGLAVIEKSKILSQVPFSETYAALQALRFMWSCGNGRIPPERLKVSMRLLLDRPELCDLAIFDLARWKDWSVQDRLIELYGTDDYNLPSIRRAIIRFMIAGTKDVDPVEGVPSPRHALRARMYLERLRGRDPKLVADAERFFLLR